MTLLNSQSPSVSTTSGDFVSAECLNELQDAIGRLQLLVCELLIKNQKLRDQVKTNTSLSTATTNEIAK